MCLFPLCQQLFVFKLISDSIVPEVAAAWALTAARSLLNALSAVPINLVAAFDAPDSARRWIVFRRIGVRICCAKRRPTRWKDMAGSVKEWRVDIELDLVVHCGGEVRLFTELRDE